MKSPDFHAFAPGIELNGGNNKDPRPPGAPPREPVREPPRPGKTQPEPTPIDDPRPPKPKRLARRLTTFAATAMPQQMNADLWGSR